MAEMTIGFPECKWCGNSHDPATLCRAMKVSRRSFIFTMGAGMAGLALAGPAFAQTGKLVTEVQGPLPFDVLKYGHAFLQGKLVGLNPEIRAEFLKIGVDLQPKRHYMAETLRQADQDLGSHYERRIHGARGEGQSMDGKTWLPKPLLIDRYNP